MQEIHCVIPVRFRDLDALGHVNYATYLNYLEEAFTRLWVAVLAKAGRTLEVQEYGCVTARTEIDYRSSAQYGETLDVAVWVTAIGKSSFTTPYRVTDQATGRLIADAQTVQVVTLPGQEKGFMPAAIRTALATMTGSRRRTSDTPKSGRRQ